jgi:hypothetical protein
MDLLKLYKNLTQQSYNDNGSRKKEMDGWKEIGGSRHVGVYQNQKTGEIHQAISGSRSISDFISDGLLGTLGIRNDNYRKRQEEAEEMARRIERVRGSNKHTISGHSLGGNLTQGLINKGFGDSGTTFNSFVTHHDYEKARHHKLTNVRNNDYASILLRNNSNTINMNPNEDYSLSNHSLSNLKI